MKLLNFVPVCALLIPCSAVYLSDFTDCGGHGIIHSVLFESCQKETCNVEGGNTYTAHINFTAREHSKTLVNLFHGVFDVGDHQQLAPLHVSPSSPCTGHGVQHGVHCPLTPGQSQVYVAKLAFTSDFLQSPSSFAGELEVRDDTGRDLICIVFPLTFNMPNH